MNSRSLWSGIRSKPLYLLLLLALAAIALWGFWPRPLRVESATVTRGPLTESFTEEGRTRLRNRYQVSAPLDGVVERIAIEPGESVSAGNVVAMLRPIRSAMLDPANRAQNQSRLRAVESEQISARAAVASARAEQERAAAALRRGLSLSVDKLIAQESLDALRAQEAASSAALRSARARTDSLAMLANGYRAVLDLQGAAGSTRLPLRAPVDGRLIRRYVESETPVRAGQALLQIGDTGTLEAVVDVLTSDAVRLRVGTPVRLQDWGGAEALGGHVRVVEPGGFTKVSALGVEEQRTLVVVALDRTRHVPDGREALGDGFRVQAEFIVWQSPSALQVPSAALFRDGKDWAVYAIEDGRARLRHIRLGHLGEETAELRSGLLEGARVVLYPGDSVRDGLRVETGGD